jgi:hypothetical protein
MIASTSGRVSEAARDDRTIPETLHPCGGPEDNRPATKAGSSVSPCPRT